MKGVINIGAHNFEEYKIWLKKGVVNFLLFEPIQANYDYLVKYQSDNIKIFKLALANYTGQSEMYIDSNHFCLSASLLMPTFHKEDYPDIAFDRKETVIVDKLDNIEYDRTLYDYIYLTAQGMELEILKGAEKSLRYINIIKTQVWRKRLYEDSFITEEMTQYLDSKGFVLKEIIKRGISWDHAVYQRKRHVKK